MTCGACGAPLEAQARFCPGCGAAVSTTEPASQRPAATANLAGREIAGRYKIIEKLGEGGMGAVFRAEQMSLKRTVALKLLRSDLSSDPGLVRRFNAEAELAAKLSHPNTVTLFDFGQDADGSLFIAMEFIEGQSLREVMVRAGALQPHRALRICEQVCASLGDAHSVGIVHRDLKPDNVMLMRRGHQTDIVRVLDFGIAKLRDERPDGSSVPMTQQGDLLGTPQYMAPEQIRADPVDGRTDVYALGAMLYEMVTGRLPFEGPTVMAILSKHLTDLPQSPVERRRDLGLPPQLDQLIMGCLQKDPAARPQSMEALGARIAQLRMLLGSATPIATARPDSMPVKRYQSRPPGVRWTPPDHQDPMPRPPSPAPAPTPPPAVMTPAPTPTPAGERQAPPAQAGGRRWLWAVAVLALVGGGATAAVLLTQNSDGDETPAATAPQPVAPDGDDFGDDDGDDDDDTGFRSSLSGDFTTNPQRDLYELDDRLEDVQEALDDVEEMRAKLKPGFGAGPGAGGDGSDYVDPTFGYVLELPEGLEQPQTTAQGAVMSGGLVDGKFMVISAMAIATDHDPSEAELESAARSLVKTLGADSVETKRYRVLGKRTWGSIYEASGFKLESVFYPADGYTVAVSVGTQVADFAATASFRRDFFKTHVRLK